MYPYTTEAELPALHNGEGRRARGNRVSDVSLEAGGQRLPAPGSGETDAAKSCSPNCLELAVERSRSDGGRESGERRWGQRGMLTDACGDTQGAGVAARGGGGGDGGG
jgi:hypothetical protein